MAFLQRTIAEISKTRSMIGLARHCQEGLATAGIRHVTYALIKPGLSFANAVVSSTYPQEWQNRYLERSYAALDPVFVSCRHSVLPVNWSQVRLPSIEGSQIMKEAGDFGIGRAGFSVPVRGPDGAFAIASFNTSDNTEKKLRDLDYVSGLVLIALHMHAQAASILGLNEIKAALTPRETEILSLLASGTTIRNASVIMKLSVRTIRFHLDNCREKMGTRSVRGAVAKAVSMGLVRAG